MKESDNIKHKIIFEEFPYEKRKIHKKKLNTNIINKTLFFIILIFLFIFSSLLNQKIIYLNESDNYKLVNMFKGNYATLKKDNMPKLFKDIGFEMHKTQTILNGNKRVSITSLYHNKNEKLYDMVILNYNENYKLSRIDLNLNYDQNEFNTKKVKADCNAIINNFVKFNTKIKYIEEAFKNGYYYLKDDKTNTSVSYQVKNIKGKYTLVVILRK